MDDNTIGNLKTISGNTGNATVAQSLPDGTLLGQYKILRLLGKGGMGEVYEAEHTTLGLKYALKVLPEDFSYKSNAVDMFKSEARVMATLKHDNIVLVDDFGNSEGRYWLRMELIEGIEGSSEVRECGIAEVGENSTDSLITTLADFAKYTGGKIEELTLAEILKQILTGLSFAHQHGAIHRDLKPSNILLQNVGDNNVIVKIADFGLVKLVGEEWVREQAEISIRQSMSIGDMKTMQGPGSSRKTTSDALVGTFEYMSPEQRDGLEITEQSDLYSVGLIAYRLLTGKKLGLKLPSRIDEFLDPLWDNFVEKALEEELEDRYQSADEMLCDINNIHQSILCSETDKTLKQTPCSEPQISDSNSLDGTEENPPIKKTKTIQKNIKRVKQQSRSVKKSNVNNNVPSGWTHERVFNALCERGEKHKDYTRKDIYVQFYPQKYNAAILYRPDSRYVNSPIHLNKNSDGWDSSKFEVDENIITYVGSSNKGPGKEKNNFDYYKVKNWNLLAKQLGLGIPSSGKSDKVSDIVYV